MSDFRTAQHDVTNEELSRIADAVEVLVEVLRTPPAVERTVYLGPVERVAGPVVGDPIGYGFAYTPAGIEAPAGHTAIDMPVQRLFLTREAAEEYVREYSELPFRVVGVYDLPQEADHA